MTGDQHNDVEVVPIPGQESDTERRRVRRSNDRDQQAEREGELAPHNAGYDKAADGSPTAADSKPIDPMNDN
jgi:hypothetical protein